MSINDYVVRAGLFRRRVTFQNRVITPDATGQPVNSWVNAFTCWADIQPMNGRELMMSQQLQSSVTHYISVRYRSELAVPKVGDNMRILYGTRPFNIHAVLNEDERKRVVTIMAEEGLNSG